MYRAKDFEALARSDAALARLREALKIATVILELPESNKDFGLHAAYGALGAVVVELGTIDAFSEHLRPLCLLYEALTELRQGVAAPMLTPPPASERPPPGEVYTRDEWVHVCAILAIEAARKTGLTLPDAAALVVRVFNRAGVTTGGTHTISPKQLSAPQITKWREKASGVSKKPRDRWLWERVHKYRDWPLTRAQAREMVDLLAATALRGIGPKSGAGK